MPHIATVSYLVPDYDEAIRWFVDVLGFVLEEDTPLPGGRRWVRVAPAGGCGGPALLLARAEDDEERAAIGRPCGGRVSLFLETDDFARDHAAYLARGVRFGETPRHERYGTVAWFEDRYGTLWDLIQPAGA
jgi:catechol 2,3-dioxygenase-like lactoylglutathione lyase family enzyme